MVGMPLKVRPLALEKRYESAGFSKENLSQLQDRTAQGCAVRDLQREKAQAAPGLSADEPVQSVKFQAFTGRLD
jgi:hypothetical protein